MRSPQKFALAGIAALAVLAAGCSSGSSSSGSSGGTDWSTKTSAAAGGGMNALVAAAKKEGTLNVIALPPDWANYGTIIKDFSQKYGIKVNSAKFGTVTSVSQLLGSKFKSAVALNGNPTQANAALNGVMMAGLASGGTPDSIAKGVAFFHSLKQAGNFVPVQATPATIKNGSTPVVINWDYLNTASVVGQTSWKVFVPGNAVLGGYYAQPSNKQAPHPAAARLWEEFLYSQAADGGQNLWLQGGARPVEMAAMTTNKTIDAAAAAKLPPVSGTPVFMNAKQSEDAANYLAANWAQAVK